MKFEVERNFLVRTYEEVDLDPKKFLHCATVEEINLELEDYFYRNKKGYNEFNHFNLNELLNDHEKLDWFIYDNESMNFLMNMNQTNIDVKAKLKVINEKLYFEDICDDEDYNLSFVQEDMNKIFLNIYYEMDNFFSGCGHC